MQAIIGCAIQDKPGRWFVQLRIPSDDLFDQHVLSNAWGDSKEEAVQAAAEAAGGVQVIPWIRKPRMTPGGLVTPPTGLLAALAGCAEAIDSLIDCMTNPHYGI